MSTAAAYQHTEIPVRTPRAPGRRRQRERLSYAELFILAVALVALIAASVLPSFRNHAETPARTQTVSVRTSQSLWDLARTYPQEGKSTAQTVELIRRINRLEQSALTPGQLLQVPAQAHVFAADARP